MNIYLISQEVNYGYDTYDSAVVCAASEEDAKRTEMSSRPHDEWCEPEDVKVELIGKSNDEEAGVILASFNAG